jgi:hypothetical protein
MSVSLSREQLGLFARLGRNPDGQMLLQVVKAWQADVDSQLRRTEGAVLHRAQGDSLRLEEIAFLLAGGADQRLSDLSRPVRPVRQTTDIGF